MLYGADLRHADLGNRVKDGFPGNSHLTQVHEHIQLA